MIYYILLVFLGWMHVTYKFHGNWIHSSFVTIRNLYSICLLMKYTARIVNWNRNVISRYLTIEQKNFRRWCIEYSAHLSYYTKPCVKWVNAKSRMNKFENFLFPLYMTNIQHRLMSNSFYTVYSSVIFEIVWNTIPTMRTILKIYYRLRHSSFSTYNVVSVDRKLNFFSIQLFMFMAHEIWWILHSLLLENSYLGFVKSSGGSSNFSSSSI